MKELIDFDLPTASENIIKVIGVGGGGSNAVASGHGGWSQSVVAGS